jgi:DNA-binding response OmpR family regulator
MAEALVLVVDDEADIRRLIEIELTSAGFAVVQAEDGASALELATEHEPQLLLVDDLLPDMRGVELIERLRAHTTAPVVMVSGYVTTQSRDEALAAGAAAHIAKPFDPRDLTALCRQLLG